MISGFSAADESIPSDPFRPGTDPAYRHLLPPEEHPVCTGSMHAGSFSKLLNHIPGEKSIPALDKTADS